MQIFRHVLTDLAKKLGQRTQDDVKNSLTETFRNRTKLCRTFLISKISAISLEPTVAGYQLIHHIKVKQRLHSRQTSFSMFTELDIHLLRKCATHLAAVKLLFSLCGFRHIVIILYT